MLTDENKNGWIDITDDYIFFKVFFHGSVADLSLLFSLCSFQNKEQFLWSSERSGFRHIYLSELSGKQLAQITSGHFSPLTLYSSPMPFPFSKFNQVIGKCLRLLASMKRMEWCTFTQRRTAQSTNAFIALTSMERLSSSPRTDPSLLSLLFIFFFKLSSLTLFKFAKI